MLWREVWSGADVSSDTWLVYAGATVAPFSHIHEQGIRFRVATGYGGYSYKNVHGTEPFEANVTYGDVLAGYLFRLDPATVKIFAGASYIDHDISPFDEDTVVAGADWGAKGVIEIWLNIGESAWSSLDLSYTTAHDTAAVRSRTGYRVMPQLSLGVEAGLNVDGQAECKMRMTPAADCRLDARDREAKSLLDFARAGLFARYEWVGGEISISGGGLGSAYSDDRLDLQPYVTVNWITQF